MTDITITLTPAEHDLVVKCIFHAVRSTDNPILAAQELTPLWQKFAHAAAPVNGTQPAAEDTAGDSHT